MSAKKVERTEKLAYRVVRCFSHYGERREVGATVMLDGTEEARYAPYVVRAEEVKKPVAKKGKAADVKPEAENDEKPEEGSDIDV